MADFSFNRFHIALMEDYLPMGMAIIDRVKKKGVRKLVEDWTESDPSMEELRGEGLEPAKEIRDKLDLIRLGLGNPALEVEVSENKTDFKDFSEESDSSLTKILARIETRLCILEEKLDDLIDL